MMVFSLALLLWTGYGHFTRIEQHPHNAQALKHKDNLPRISYQEAKQQLADLSGTPRSVAEQATAIVASRVINYWPQPEDNNDPQIYRSWGENWILSLLAHGEALAVDFGWQGPRRFTRLERFELDRILQKGVGFCSQVSIALQEFLMSRGIESELAGLGGHVVLQVNFSEGPVIMDPDYNVILPGGITEIEASPELVGPYYARRGYSEQRAEWMVETYGRDGNAPYGTRIALLVEFLGVLKWAIPGIAFAFSLWIVMRQKKLPPAVNT